ncbi:MAG: IclR family transcriptional regulator [Pseudomonadota bacterium]
MIADDEIRAQRAQIPTNLRLLLIVEAVAKAGVPVTPSALSDALGLPKATIHRLLTTAEEEGFLQRDVDGRSYGPGRRLRRLAGTTLSSERLRTERLAIMKSLADDVGETCNLAAPGRYGMVYLDRVETHWPLRIQLPIGTQVPFHCTASGKMYLSSLRADKLDRLLRVLPLDRHTDRTLITESALRADLQDVRRRGYATDDGEFMDDMTAVAVAIEDNVGRLLSTLSMHAPAQRSHLEKLLDKLPKLQAAATKLSDLSQS